ncbi:hypothetical protein I6A84_02145 [Frankia sp. CNm7]|uniref:Uncharacterized protein n=1 Tax=Frankia nepalensis TaxID=1836974 RepID=A0A937ULF1_9ACTN|nr:hypothetical protein [Frankia nepalensis]MBL7499864.1 hypothetical protein [Frankia nepalensis]MBL7512318.1 hypothetical protein [Frankia nepalensis]MBL7516958.1 hypothetical protein [Frankia nepalensis]MBL7625727.1 hypothetical protein [Frankia nepalensis]
MHDNLYSTVAQVLPVLLLAMMWDSAYLTRLRHQDRPSRRHNPVDGFRWTKPRVRVYVLTVTCVVMADLLLSIAVLAGIVPDILGVRIAAVAGVVIGLGSLLVRVWFDVLEATSTMPPTPPASPPGP